MVKQNPSKKVTFSRKRRSYRRRRATIKKSKPTIRKNSRALVRLNKRVINASAGHYQTNFQRLSGVTPYQISPGFPLAFCMEDFTSRTSANAGGGKIYGCSFTGISPDIINTPLVTDQWISVNPAQSFGMALKFRQWSDSNNDTASLTAYMPISVSYALTFSRTTQTAEQHDEFIRVDEISPKRRYLNSVHHQYNMPDCLGSFQEMAIANDQGQRNKYNPALWNVKTRWLKLPANQSSATMTLPGKTMKVYKKFKPRLIKLDLDYQASTSQYEDFVYATDPAKQTWIVINTSNRPVSPNPNLRHSFTRTIRYRDQHGASN